MRQGGFCGEGAAAAFQMGIVGVFGDLAQPHPDVAVSPELVDGAQRLEKGVRRDLFGQMRIAGEAKDVPVNIPEIGFVYLLEGQGSITTFLSPCL